jgi:hypothetical protein
VTNFWGFYPYSVTYSDEKSKNNRGLESRKAPPTTDYQRNQKYGQTTVKTLQKMAGFENLAYAFTNLNISDLSEDCNLII